MYTVAIDLGGTIVKIGLLHGTHLVDCMRLEAQLARGLALNLPRIEEAINQMLLRAQVNPAQLTGIGLAFPGLVNPVEKRVISTNEKYDDAIQYDLKSWVAMNWDIPFYIDNDARLAVVGEWWQGAAVGHNNVVMMTIGTGIGTGVIIDGKVLHGQHFQAGSLGGHFVVDYRGRPCSCGNKGCVEAMASSFFLESIVQEHPLLSEAAKRNPELLNLKSLFLLAQKGEPEAIIVRNECLDVWSAAVITYIHAYDPEVVVLGGGAMNSSEVIIPYLQAKTNQHAWCPSGKIKIVRSELNDNAALLGLGYYLGNGSFPSSGLPSLRAESPVYTSPGQRPG